MTFRVLFAVAAAFPALAQMPAPPPAVPRPRPPAAPAHRDLKFAPIRPIEPPRPVRFELSNGMKVMAVEDHETPLVTVGAVIRAGSALDPPNLTGLATVTAALLRVGGTSRKSEAAFEGELDAAGATIDVGFGERAGTLSLTVLRENLASALPLFREVLTQPDFRRDKLDLVRGNMAHAVRRRNDDSREVLRREFYAAALGPAYSRRVEYDTLTRISRGDVLAFYRRYVHPANVTLAISGDFDTAQMKDVIETLFGGWKPPSQPAPEFPNAAPPAAGGVRLAVRPEWKETHIAIGQSGVAFDDPDTASLEIAAAILGLGPNSRLMKRARETPGALREIRAEWTPGFASPGHFAVTATGPASSAPNNVRMIFEEIQKLRSTPCSENEVRAARDVVLMKTIAGMDNRTRALAALARLDYSGLPPDSFQRFQKALYAVTPADVLRAAQTKLDPDRLATVVVSNVANFGAPIDPRGGAPAPIDLTIPETPASAVEPTAASAEAGRKMIERAQQASGGVDKLAATKDFTQTATYVGSDGVRETQTDRWVAPNHLRQDLQSTRIGALYRYADGASGWLSNGRASAALTGAGARQAQEEMLRVYLLMLLSDRLPGRTVAALDEESVEIRQGAASARLVFDPNTGLPAKLLYDQQLERQAPVFVEEEYSDFRDVGGLKIPFAITVRRNGIKYADGAVGEFKINQGLRVEILQRRP